MFNHWNRSILVPILMLFAFTLAGQSIDRAEYFIDTDPGTGSGMNISITPSGSLEEQLTVDLTGTAVGSHVLYIRTRQDNGLWSLSRAIPFNVQDTVQQLAINETRALVALEYYIDKDPGAGKGQTIPLTVLSSIEGGFSFSTAGLKLGEHSVYVRAKDNTGVWSQVIAQKFAVMPSEQMFPVPQFEADTVALGETTTFVNTSDSVDANTTYKWDLFDDGEVDFTTEQISFAFDVTGIIPVRLTAFNGTDSASYLGKVIVGDFENRSITVGNDVLCEGEETILTAPDGYSLYAWNTGDSTQAITVAESGNYSALLTDNNGTTIKSKSVSVTVFEDFVATVYKQDASNGLENGYAEVRIDGADLSEFSYLWTDGSTKSYFTDLRPSSYAVEVTRGGCSQVISFVINNNTVTTENEPVATDIIRAEYFFDNDPGVGNGTALSASQNDEVIQTSIIDISALDVGSHHLYIRTKGNNGLWSISRQMPFYVQDTEADVPVFEEQNIVAAEVFIDNDPGVGKGSPVAVSAPTMDFSGDINISPDTLSQGQHTLYMRTKSETGVWSLAGVMDFQVCGLLPPTLTASDITACPGENITLQVSGETNNTYAWYAADTTLIENQTSATYTVGMITSDTTFYVSQIDPAGCQSQLAEINITAPALALYAGLDLEISKVGNDIQLNGYFPTNGTWTGVSFIDENGLINRSNISPNSYNANYQVDAEGCTFTDTRVVSVLDLSQSLENTIAENPEGGAVLASVDIQDEVESYTVQSGETSAISISPSGEITVQDVSFFDFEANQTLTWTIWAEVTEYLTHEIDLTINLTNETDPPVIEDQTFSVPENSENNTIVGTISASDQDSPTLQYTITAGNEEGVFGLTNTNQLEVVDGSMLDFEMKSVYELTVSVTDGTLSAEATITINVEDVQENLPPEVQDQAFTIDESSAVGTVIGTISATDPEDDVLTYSITGGNSSKLWTGDEITFTKADGADPTLEANQDRLTDNVWITRGNEGGQIFNIQVENAAVKETSPADTEWAIGSLDEISDLTFAAFRTTIDPKNVVGVEMVLHLITDDLYIPITFTSWSQGKLGGFSYTRGTPATPFDLNSETGELTVANSEALDFETNPTFNLDVEVSDGTSSASAAVTVMLNDIEENQAPGIQDQIFEVNEESPEGTLVGTVVASDPADDPLTFSITEGNDAGSFMIDELNGDLTVADPAELDYETNPSISIVVEVTDGSQSANAIITINLIDINESNTAPVVEDQNFTMNQDVQNGAVIGQIEAVDTENDALTFMVTEGNIEGVLQVAENTGEILVEDASQIDPSQTPEYAFAVSVSDGQLSTEAIIRIEVLSDGSNSQPVIEDQAFTLSSPAENGQLVGVIVANDSDGDELSYFITDGNDEGAFTLAETTGELLVADPDVVASNIDQSITIGVAVSDGELDDNASITISIVDGAQNTPPTIEAQSFSILENSEQGTNVGTIQAEDVDDNALTFSILSGNESGAFALSSSTGELIVANSSPLDYEVNPTLVFEVEVSDGIATASAPITINLIDQEEGNNNPPTVANSISNQSFIENTGSLNIDVSGTFSDPDGDDLRLVAASADTSIIFATILGQELILKGKETGTTSITVSAFDDRGGSVNTSFSATLEENTNNEPTVANPVDDVVLTEGFETYRVDLTDVFDDPDGGSLTYGVKSGSDVELIADFVILPECCGKTTGTGRYLDGVYIEFENRSSDNAVEFEWSFGSTEENPSGYFSLSNIFAVNTRTFELKVTDADGNTASVEKSFEFPMLLASGYIQVDGETFDLNQYDEQVDFRIDYHQYTDGNVGQGFLGYTFSELPINMVLRIGGYPPSGTFNMRQVDQFSPTSPNNFFFSYENYSTISDEGGTLSGGSVTINSDTELDNVIDAISIEGVMAFQNDDTDRKPFKIELKHVPVTCYYDGVFCIDGTERQSESFTPMVKDLDPKSMSPMSPKMTSYTSTDGVIITVIEGSEVVITEIGIGQTNVLVLATDDAGAVVTDQFLFEIEEQPNRNPVIEDQDFTIEPSTATQGQVIGTIEASDEDGDELTFGIEMGNEAGIFALDETTGVLTLADLDALQSSDEEFYYLDVFASDGQFSTGALVTIQVGSIPVMEDQTFTVEENAEVGTVIGIVQATDPAGGDLLFFLESGNESGAFELDLDGTLKVADSAPLDKSVNPFFSLEVEAENEQGNYIGATITVEVVEENSNALGLDFSAVQIYPNPMGEQLFVDLPEGLQDARVTIFDILGNTIVPTESAKNSYDTSGLASGIYMVRIEADGFEKMYRILKK